jgi:hypothetical protein
MAAFGVIFYNLSTETKTVVNYTTYYGIKIPNVQVVHPYDYLLYPGIILVIAGIIAVIIGILTFQKNQG